MLKSVGISAEQIRAARAFLGLSQDQLADAAGITRKSLYEMEHGGESMPSTTIAVRRALEARGIWFVDHEGKIGLFGDRAK